MKSLKYFICALALSAAGACEQELIKTEPPVVVVDTSCEDAAAGTVDFTKVIALGNSFVAGMQGGALFTDGQDNSLAAILNTQFECAGASTTFNQPDINATLGWNLFITQPILTDGVSPILGRMLLQYGDNVSCASGAPSPLPTPQAYGAGELEALPNPGLNPGFMYGGDKAELNNFSVPAVTLGQVLIPNTGNWGNPNPAVGFNPFYARFASVPGTSTMLSDASFSGPTFAVIWLGLDDFFLHAAYGGDSNYAPLTTAGDFQTRFGAIFGHPSVGLLTLNPDMKGVVGNFPNIFKMPHFTSVSYNPIPLDADQVGDLTAGFAGYNALLDGISANAALLANFGLDADELQSRKLAWEASCTNKILMTDETLDDLGNVFDYLRSVGQIPDDASRAALVPYEQVRHSNQNDIIPLSTGSVLGENGTFGVLGVSEPVGDRYVLIPTEQEAIETARVTFNTIVAATVDAFSDNLALADVDTQLETLITNRAGVYNGVTITPNINPPTGIYSEDGVHPNTRGYAFISNAFIKAINTKFGSTIPLTNIGHYQATGLPIP